MLLSLNKQNNFVRYRFSLQCLEIVADERRQRTDLKVKLKLIINECFTAFNECSVLYIQETDS